MRRRRLLVAFLFLAGIQLHAQAIQPTFSVASVKENKSDAKPASNIPLNRGKTYSPTGGALTAINQPLLAYIAFAYHVEIAETTDGLVKKLPEWAYHDRFDIIAKTDAPTPTKEDMRVMMQRLLEDRFKLTVHRYQKKMPGLALTLIKPGTLGPQFRPHEPAASCSNPVPDHPSLLAATALVGVWPGLCGDGEVMRRSVTATRIGGRDMTMSSIASWLTGSGDGSGQIDRPIFDRTGLTGTYDFVLDYSSDQPSAPAPNNPSQDQDPTFLQAVNDQLGLRLQKEEGEFTFFSIDHIEYPTAN